MALLPLFFLSITIHAAGILSNDDSPVIAELFPSELTSWTSVVSDKRKVEILYSILNVTEALMSTMPSISNLEKWQKKRIKHIESIRSRHQKNPELPIRNAIPKWYHGFFLQPPRRVPQAKGDWELEKRNLTYSLYPFENDGFKSSWYLAFEPDPTIPLFVSDGSIECVDWIVEDESHIANFTLLLDKYLSPAEQKAVLNSVVFSDEARLQDVIIKLARVYSFDRANLVSEVTVLPLWTNYSPANYPVVHGFNWCAAKICLNGASSPDNLATSLGSLRRGDIIRTWGYGDEISNVTLDVDTVHCKTDYFTRQVLVRRVSEGDFLANSTHIPTTAFSARSIRFNSKAVGVVQLFGTVPESVLNRTDIDINVLIADGKWEDSVASFPYEAWGWECGSSFCLSLWSNQEPS
eukprot:jgi/Bigna1/131762/aug1.15_g6470